MEINPRRRSTWTAAALDEEGYRYINLPGKPGYEPAKPGYEPAKPDGSVIGPIPLLAGAAAP